MAKAKKTAGTKTKRKSFTPLCYGVIAVLVENPESVFALTQQRVAERMVEYGWLTQRKITRRETAGGYTYDAEFLNFVPTEEGLRLFGDLNKLVKEVNPDDVKKAIQGERYKQHLKRKLK